MSSERLAAALLDAQRSVDIQREMLSAMAAERDRAVKSLELGGYTDEGGELWQPPLGSRQPLLALWRAEKKVAETTQTLQRVTELLQQYREAARFLGERLAANVGCPPDDYAQTRVCICNGDAVLMGVCNIQWAMAEAEKVIKVGA